MPKRAARPLQKMQRLHGIEIADRRSGKEAQPRQRRHLRRQCDNIHEIGRHDADLEIRPLLAQPQAHLLELRLCDVDRHIGAEGPFAQQELGLRLVARAIFHQHRRSAHKSRNARRDIGQQRALGTRQVVFRQLSDAAEQTAAFLVVEQLCRQRLAWL